MVYDSMLHGAPYKYDYSKLLGRIKEYCGKQCVFAAAMGLSERSVSLKLNNIRCWTQQEMQRACDVLMFPSAEIPNYFFVPIVHKCEYSRTAPQIKE